ncbi:MAG: CHAT domain-containing protein [Clostridiales bacterium]
MEKKFILKEMEHHRFSNELLHKGYHYTNKGDFKKGNEFFIECIKINDEMIANEKQFNQKRIKGYFDIKARVRERVLATKVLAENKLKFSDKKTSDELWKQIEKLINEYLEEEDCINIKLDRAYLLKEVGYYNEALINLLSCIKYYKNKKYDLKLIEAELKYIDLLIWFKDYKRALKHLKDIKEILDKKVILKDNIIRFINSEKEHSELLKELEVKLEDSSAKRIEYESKLYYYNMDTIYKYAVIYKEIGNYNEALLQFKLLLNLYDEDYLILAVEFHKVFILFKKKMYKEAMGNIKKLEEATKDRDDYLTAWPSIYIVEAQIYYNMNKFEKALESVEKGLKIFTRIKNIESYWNIIYWKAKILEKIGNRNKALEYYKRTTDEIDQLRTVPLGYRIDSLFLTDKIEIFRCAYIFCYNNCFINDICRISNMVKSKSLSLRLYSKINNSNFDNDYNSLIAEFENINNKKDAFEQSNINNKISKLEYLKIRKKIIYEREEILEKIRIFDPRWRNLSIKNDLILEQVIRKLQYKNQVLLDIFCIGNNIYTTLISYDKLKVSKISIDESIREKIEKYNESIISRDSNPENFDIFNFKIELIDLIPEELIQLSVSYSSILISAHSFLHLISWSSMIYNKKRFFEYCPVGIIPNISSVLYLDYEVNKSPYISIVGNVDYSDKDKLNLLEYTKEEIDGLEKLYKKPNLLNNVFKGKEANAKNFWSLVKHHKIKCDILHISSHGEFDFEEPMNSGLIMYDKKIDAASISNVRIRFDEVILSACHVGIRPSKIAEIELIGDDILGIPAAFLEAGVRTILASIPEANDESATKFMLKYHEFRLNGLSPLYAFQKTQLYMLEEDYDFSFLWVGFNLFGCC